MEKSEPRPVLLLVADDLMFPSRVREGAKPMGYDVKVAASETAALDAARTLGPVAVLVNLTARRYDPNAIIAAFKADAGTRSLPLLAFAGHVEREKHEAARASGADMVAANSSVSLHLPALLKRLLFSSTPETDVVEIEETS